MLLEDGTSLAYATIDSKDRDIQVRSFGHLADLVQHLYVDGRCSLFCKGTGCKNMDYVCLPGAVCNIQPNGCGGRIVRAIVDGNSCPNMLTSIPTEKDYENMKFINI